MLTIPPVATKVSTQRAASRGHGVDAVKRRIRTNSLQAVRNFGRNAEGLTRLVAPVDTGYMKSKVGHEVDELMLVAEVFVDGYVDARVGAFYAVYVEYGTRHMAAQPFFWPSVRTAQREFVAEMMRVFK